MRVLILSTCAGLHVLGTARRLGHDVDNYLIAFGRQQDLQPIRDFQPRSYDLTIVVPTLRTVLAEASGCANELAFWRQDTSELFDECADYLATKLAEVADCLDGAVTFVGGFFEPSRSYVGTLQRYDEELDFKEFVHRLNKRLKALTRDHANMWFIDPNPTLDGIGRDGLQDDIAISSTHGGFVSNHDFGLDSHRLTSPVRATELFGPADGPKRYGRSMWDQIERLHAVVTLGQRIKCIVLDLDGTLWRGSPDDDLSMLERRSDWPLGLVEALLIYKRRGGLLAICSQGSETETLGHLTKIWGHIFAPDDFASIQIGPDSKSDGIARILADLNVSPDETLFIDDDPRELADARARFPTLNVSSDNHYLWRSQILFSAETQVAQLERAPLSSPRLAQGTPA